MPSLRRGDGQRLVAALDSGTEIAAETTNGPDIDSDSEPLEKWRRGELNPRPEELYDSVYVCSLVY